MFHALYVETQHRNVPICEFFVGGCTSLASMHALIINFCCIDGRFITGLLFNNAIF